ncbi:hypothetical protein COCMIDRAFT_30290 [Bipolaris oryzae ATCC 44560]|uniref:Secreted protein n=1 Tax=Bipolaris oryzae ATCC 44560 TaxID=930090 RepID=W6YTH6_COCMI|nr:uncharacterized protein COCMIDRAFT_30290 [Bipolaris oryzae ATCC 44560]EUC40843.1 hypothetical protein COCMIDRAFT_30290 [Bipolaris oryzae ATCC 44560]
MSMSMSMSMSICCLLHSASPATPKVAAATACVSAALPIARYSPPVSSVHVLHAKRPDGFKHLFSALGSLPAPATATATAAAAATATSTVLARVSQHAYCCCCCCCCYYYCYNMLLDKPFSQMPIPKPHVAQQTNATLLCLQSPAFTLEPYFFIATHTHTH